MGKQVVSREDFLTRIRAAVIARDAIPNSDFVRLHICMGLAPLIRWLTFI
jgi:2-methylisocitrate lyase-like PEP mutase family enzyme